jgi:gas vesicle protein
LERTLKKRKVYYQQNIKINKININLKIKVMDTGKVVLGVLGGIAAGAVLGILFAPNKGSVTRRKIQRKGEDLMDNMKDIKENFDDFVETMSEKISSLNETVNETAHKTKAKAESATVGSNHNR